MAPLNVKIGDIVWYHRWFALTLFAIVVVAVFVGSKCQQAVYGVNAEVYIVPKPSTITGDPTANFNDADYRTLNNQVEILSSDQVASKAVQYIQERLGKNFPVSSAVLQNNLTLQKKEYTNVITLSLTGTAKPADLQRMLQEYLRAYQNTLESMNSDKSTRERDFLQKQLQAAQVELLDAGRRMQAFESENKAYNIDAQVRQLLEVSGRIDEQGKSVEADIAAVRRQIDSTRRHLPASPEYINFMARIERDPEADGLRKKIVAMETEKAEWASKLTDSHPKMIAYHQELIHLQTLLDERLQVFSKQFQQAAPQKASAITTGSHLDFNLASDIINNQIKLDALQARAASIAATKQEMAGLLKGVPQQTLDYAALKTRYELTQEKARLLQKRLDEAAMMQEVSKNFTRLEILKNPIIPQAPLRPNLSKNMTAAVLLGFCLAIFGVFVRASVDRTLRWPFQLNGMVKETEGQILMTLPEVPPPKRVATLLEAHGMKVPEAYQRLALQLDQASQESGLRRIGLLPVGACPLSGSAALLLSLYLTELGHKLMILDTDFTDNSITEGLCRLKLPISRSVQDGPGLSDYLSGHVEDFVDVIYPLGKTVFGSLIPSGRLVNGAEARFSARHWEHVQENLSPHYQFIFYSLPAIESSYDAVALSRTLDGVFLLVHPGETQLKQIHQTLHDLQSAHTRILGFLSHSDTE